MAGEDKQGEGIDRDSTSGRKSPFSRGRLEFYFLNSAGVILFIAAALNFFAGAQTASPLDWPHALFQLNAHLALSNRWTLLLSGALELFVSAGLLSSRDARFKLRLLAWFATTSATYRIGLRITGGMNLSDCLGNYVEWFFIRPQVVASAFNVGLGFMLIASYTLLLVNWLAVRKRSERLALVGTGKSALSS